MIALFIEEEYGYRQWLALLDKVEWYELVARWRTMAALNSLVPVPLVVPKARMIVLGPWPEEQEEPPPDPFLALWDWATRSCSTVLDCHLHEHDDSFLQGVEYDIPPPPEGELDCSFSLEGREYTCGQLSGFCQDWGDRPRRETCWGWLEDERVLHFPF